MWNSRPESGSNLKVANADRLKSHSQSRSCLEIMLQVYVKIDRSLIRFYDRSGWCKVSPVDPFLIAFPSCPNMIQLVVLLQPRLSRACLHRSLDATAILQITDARRTRVRIIVVLAVNLNSILPEQVHIPIISTTKDRTANNIPNQGRDDSFPDVQAYSNVRIAIKDTQWNKCHIRNHVVKPDRHEGKDGEPDSDNFSSDIAGLHAEEAGETDEPVAAHAADEDLVPVWRDLFLGGECDNFFGVCVDREDATICAAICQTE